MSEILNLAYKYKLEYGKSFDIKAFLDAAKKNKAATLNPGNFLRKQQNDKQKQNKNKNKQKDKKKTPKLKQNGGGFEMDFSNGKCVARGFGSHQGTELSAKNAYQLFMQMNKLMNAQWESEKKPPEDRVATLYVPSHERNKDTIMKDCFKAAINSNIIMNGHLPEDKEFYARMKKEFLQNPKNKEQDWKRLTRFVPPAYMPAEKDQDQDKNNKKQPLSPSALAAMRARAGGR